VDRAIKMALRDFAAEAQALLLASWRRWQAWAGMKDAD
jgi:hypothetical protein